MNGKTYTAAAVVGLCGVLQFLKAQGHCDGCDKLADALLYLGGVLGLVGLRHAISKSAKILILGALLLGAGGTRAQTTIDIEAGGAREQTAERTEPPLPRGSLDRARDRRGSDLDAALIWRFGPGGEMTESLGTGARNSEEADALRAQGGLA